MKRAIALLVIVTGITGCVRLRVPAPEVRSYRLDYPPPTADGTPLSAVLRIASIGVAAIYDREPIVYREDEYSTGIYFNSRWSANPGSMIADLLARDFAASNLYRAVQQGPSMVPSDYLLSGEIEEIDERPAGNSCAAQLRIRSTVVPTRRGTAGRVLMQRTYTDEEPCACNQPRSLAAAMSQVLARLSAQLQHDVYEAIATDSAAHD